MSVAGNRVLPMYVDTDNGNADIYTNLIVHGPATDFCMGLACPCGNDTLAGGCGNAGFDGDASSGGILAASGSADVAADDLVLSISGMAPNQFGIVYSGFSTVSLPFGNGLRCIGGTVLRYPVRLADAAGVLSYGPGEIVSLSGGATGVVTPGERRFYQGWYRDPGGPCGSSFNLSNGLMVDWQ